MPLGVFEAIRKTYQQQYSLDLGPLLHKREFGSSAQNIFGVELELLTDYVKSNVKSIPGGISVLRKKCGHTGVWPIGCGALRLQLSGT